MAVAAPGQLNLEEYPVLGSRTIDCFERLEQIGEGTYGQVFKAKETRTGEIAALKKIRMDNEKEGFPITAIREIKLLKKLNHDNIIHLKEIVTSPGIENAQEGKPDASKYRGNIYMVFEYMDHDLTGLLASGAKFTVPQIKCYMKQLLMGLHFCHLNKVLHRDMKGSNLLLSNKGELKLADFGLARSFTNDANADMTNRVITLWYRPPELLLGSTKYGKAVDIWSVGCIFAELLKGNPIFPGKNEMDQVCCIYRICGSADENNWPGVSKLPYFSQTRPHWPIKRRLREEYRQFDRHALDLLDGLLTLDPRKRITAEQALDSEYFWTEPYPSDPGSLPRYESSHEFHTKKKRQEQRAQLEETSNKKHRTHNVQLLQAPQHNTHQPPVSHTMQPHPPARPTLPNQQHIHTMPPPPAAGPSRRYDVHQGTGRYSQGQNLSGPYHSGHHGTIVAGAVPYPSAQQQHVPPYGGGLHGVSSAARAGPGGHHEVGGAYGGGPKAPPGRGPVLLVGDNKQHQQYGRH